MKNLKGWGIENNRFVFASPGCVESDLTTGGKAFVDKSREQPVDFIGVDGLGNLLK